jgi:hypothetical protein
MADVKHEMLLTAYQRLLDLHMDALLTHGPQVAQGLALAIGEIHSMLPEPEKAAALQQWAERTPGDQADSGDRCPNGQDQSECREIDPCESCWQDQQGEGDMIEESMGLRR